VLLLRVVLTFTLPFNELNHVGYGWVPITTPRVVLTSTLPFNELNLPPSTFHLPPSTLPFNELNHVGYGWVPITTPATTRKYSECYYCFRLLHLTSLHCTVLNVQGFPCKIKMTGNSCHFFTSIIRSFSSK